MGLACGAAYRAEVEAPGGILCQLYCKEFSTFLVLVVDQSLHMLFNVSYGSV